MYSHRATNFVDQSENRSTSSGVLGQISPVPDNYGLIVSATIYPPHAEDLSREEYNVLFEDAQEWLNEQRFVAEVDSVNTFRVFLFDLSTVSCIAASGANCICATCLKITGQQNQGFNQHKPLSEVPSGLEASDELQNDTEEFMQLDSTNDSGVEDENSPLSTEPTNSWYGSDIEIGSPVGTPFQPLATSSSQTMKSTTTRRKRQHSTQSSSNPKTGIEDVMPDEPNQRRRFGRSIHRPSRFNEFETSFCKIRRRK